jgi:hypothetical protein
METTLIFHCDFGEYSFHDRSSLLKIISHRSDIFEPKEHLREVLHSKQKVLHDTSERKERVRDMYLIIHQDEFDTSERREHLREVLHLKQKANSDTLEIPEHKRDISLNISKPRYDFSGHREQSNHRMSYLPPSDSLEAIKM